MRIDDLAFLIIGATKSATTWLQQSLQRDAHVYMPDPELHYFSRQFSKGQDWYLSQFQGADRSRVIGEKSNSYLEAPQAAQRIKDSVPNVLLIAQLRNPVDRAYSDYCMLLRRGDVTRNIEAYLDPRKGAQERFLAWGLYYQQLSRYLDLFSRDRLNLLLFEDLLNDPQTHLNAVRDFLNLSPQQSVVPLSTKVKDRNQPVVGPNLAPPGWTVQAGAGAVSAYSADAAAALGGRTANDLPAIGTRYPPADDRLLRERHRKAWYADRIVICPHG